MMDQAAFAALSESVRILTQRVDAYDTLFSTKAEHQVLHAGVETIRQAGLGLETQLKDMKKEFEGQIADGVAKAKAAEAVAAGALQGVSSQVPSSQGVADKRKRLDRLLEGREAIERYTGMLKGPPFREWSDDLADIFEQ